MDELDTYLKTHPFLKSAGAKDLARRAWEAGKTYARANKPEIAGALVGGALGAGHGYLLNKRWKKGKPSFQETDAQGALESQRGVGEALRKKGKKPGYRHKLEDTLVKAYHGFARAGAEHPVAASTLFGLAGAGLGKDLVSLVRSWE